MPSRPLPLKAYFDEHQREAELARSILERQIRADLVERSGIRYVVMPAAQFSGDLVLGSRSPTGVLYALLADATGHGLALRSASCPSCKSSTGWSSRTCLWWG